MNYFAVAKEKAQMPVINHATEKRKATVKDKALVEILPNLT